MRGGRPGFSFNNFIIDGFYGQNQIKDLRMTSVLPEHRYDDLFWAHLRPDIARINVPMYVVASYTTGLHSVGSVQVFRDAVVKEKWLRFHDSQEWYDIADLKNLDDLQAFYDAYAMLGDKGAQARSTWEARTPKVRNCILPFGDRARGIIATSECYPPPAKSTLELYLDKYGKLTEDRSALESTKDNAQYDSAQYRASTYFDWKSDRRVVLCGMPKVVLHAAPASHTESGDEMDIVVLVRKLDRYGKPMVHLSIPLESLQKVAIELGNDVPKSEKDIDDVQTMKQFGAHGIMRISHRTVATDKDGRKIELIPGYPHHSHSETDAKSALAVQRERFKQGEVVGFETGLWPIGMLIEPGEGIRLEIGGNILWAPEFEMLRALQIEENENKGIHQIHYGSGVDSDGLGLSRLMLPVADLEVV
jgi:hypothetical protein